MMFIELNGISMNLIYLSMILINFAFGGLIVENEKLLPRTPKQVW